MPRHKESTDSLCKKLVAVVDPLQYLKEVHPERLAEWTSALQNFAPKSGMTYPQWISRLNVATLTDLRNFLQSQEKKMSNKIPLEVPRIHGLSREASVLMCGIRSMQKQSGLRANMNAAKYNVLFRQFPLGLTAAQRSRPLSYNALKVFLEKEMKMYANYQPIMIKILLSQRATREQIAKVLASNNAHSPSQDFRYVPVYDVLLERGIVRKEGEYFVLNIEAMTAEEQDHIENICDEKINQFKSDSSFVVNHFYNREEIWPKFGVGARGGIRYNKTRNLVLLFSDAHEDRPATDYGRNIYNDYYDNELGLYRYTGGGQKGNQEFSRGNKWLAAARERNTQIHLFRQHNPAGKHEYLGLVSVEGHNEEIQKDADGKERQVIVFWLKLLSNPKLGEEEAVYREIESDLESEIRKKRPISKEEIAYQIAQVSEKIAEQGPRVTTVTARSKEQYQRFKRIVVLLKRLYDAKCQVCGMPHFRTASGVYSEVHHLVEWSVSRDDTKENLVVICATCHRKFHHATDSERQKMFDQLISRSPNIRFKLPAFINRVESM